VKRRKLYDALEHKQNICVCCKIRSYKILKKCLLHAFGITTGHYKARTQKLLHLSEKQLSKKKEDMILGILVAITVISFPVHGALPITDYEYPLMHYSY